MKHEIDENFFKWYDEKHVLFPLTYNFTFENVFRRKYAYLEKFVSEILGLNFSGHAKVYFEEDYLKITKGSDSLRIYITINDYTELVAVVDREFVSGQYFQDWLKSNYWHKLNMGEITDEFSNKVFENIVDVITTVNVKMGHSNPYLFQLCFGLDTSFISKLSFDEKILNKRFIWLAALTATSYTELYRLLSHVLEEDDLNLFMSFVMDMCNNDDIDYKMEKEYHRELKRNQKIYDEKEEDIKKFKLECAEKMLKENISKDTILKILDLTIEEINAIDEDDT